MTRLYRQTHVDEPGLFAFGRKLPLSSISVAKRVSVPAITNKDGAGEMLENGLKMMP